MKQYYVYMMASRHRTALYVGVTNDLQRRVHEHKSRSIAGFTNRYHAKSLVNYETTNDVREAIIREKAIKGWTRAKKVALIESVNPVWADLSESWFDPAPPPDAFATAPG